MKITKRQLKRIIREEVNRQVLLEYELAIVRRGEDLYLVNDEGDEEYYGDAEDMPELEDGEAVPHEGGYPNRSSYGRGYGGGYGGGRRRRGGYRRW
jgi:hypothetical protein